MSEAPTKKIPPPAGRGRGQGGGSKAPTQSSVGRGYGYIPKKEKVPAKLHLDETSKVAVAPHSLGKDAVVVTITTGEKTFQVNYTRGIGHHGLSDEAYIRTDPGSFSELALRAKDPRANERAARVRDKALNMTNASHTHTALKSVDGHETLLAVLNGKEVDVLERDDKRQFVYEVSFPKVIADYKKFMAAAAEEFAYSTMAGPYADVHQDAIKVGEFPRQTQLLDALRAHIMSFDADAHSHPTGGGQRADKPAEGGTATRGSDPLDQKHDKPAGAAGADCTGLFS